MFRLLLAILFAPCLWAQVPIVTDIERAPARSGDWGIRYYQLGERVIVIKGTSKAQTLQLWEVGEHNAMTLLSTGEHGNVLGLQVWNGRLIYATEGKPREPSVLWGIEKPGAEPVRLGEYKFKPATVFGIPTVSQLSAGVLFISGNDLVLTDGTPAGTKVVKTMPEHRGGGGTFVGKAGGAPLLLVPAEDGYSLWKTDGTADGTIELAAIVTKGYPVKHLADGEGAAFLINGEGGQIWHSDGTTVGTRKLVQPTAERTSVFDFAVLGDQYLFSMLGPNCELHALKRGAEKPEVVVNFGRNRGGQTVAHDLTTVGSLIYYRRESAIWRTDGTAEGTLMLAEGLSRGSTSVFTPAGGRCVFRSADGLGFTDGTTAGTQSTADFGLWLPDADGAKLRFVSGGRWCETDGTPAGTREVLDLVGATADSDLHGLTAMGDSLYGVAFVKSANGDTRTRLYRVPPQGAPVVIATAPDQSTISHLVATDRFLFFTISSMRRGTEALWVSDGTPDGTRVVRADLESIRTMQALGTKLYFQVFYESCLWQSDGTAEGTKKVLNADGKPLEGVDTILPDRDMPPDMIMPIGLPLKSGLLVAAETFEKGSFLYVLGESVETITIFSKQEGTRGDINLFALADGAGVAFNSGDECALWFSDGTEAGTRELFKLKDANILCSRPYTANQGDATWFVVKSTDGKFSAWRSRGTPVSTMRVCDLPDPGRNPIAGMHANVDGTLVWATEKGTWRVGPELEKPEQLSSAPAVLATSGAQGLHIIEKAENKPARLVLVADSKLSEVRELAEAMRFSAMPEALRDGEIWWFVAYHEDYGTEPWRIDLKKE